jgi:hypothetical membrane protein
MTTNIMHIAGFTGTGLIFLAVLFPVFLYRGQGGERFSLLNHFISELGELGISRAAWIFNTGLLLGGLILLPYVIGLGIVFGSLLGWLGTAAGIIAVLGVAAVGVFPMNNIKPHATAAMTYFRAGLVMVFFFGLAIFFQPAGKAMIPAAIPSQPSQLPNAIPRPITYGSSISPPNSRPVLKIQAAREIPNSPSSEMKWLSNEKRSPRCPRYINTGNRTARNINPVPV